MKLISQGAEAKIFSDGKNVTKHRVSKSYRIPELDLKIRKLRTRCEAKIIFILQKGGIPVPNIISFSDKDMTIDMEHVEGKRLMEVMDSSNCRRLFSELGKIVGLMHNLGVIHADLTSSNVISSKNGLVLVDFGLSFLSQKVEDKAVDIHLLRQTLTAGHFKISEKSFDSFLQGYRKTSKKFSAVLKRLEIVESRGRNKMKSKGDVWRE